MAEAIDLSWDWSFGSVGTEYHRQEVFPTGTYLITDDDAFITDDEIEYIIL